MTRRTLVVLLLACVAACGRKARPIPPELAHPKAPTELVLSRVDGGVKLQWARPTEYISGKRMHDLDGFTIERAQERGGALPFTTVATVPIPDKFRFQQAKRLEWLDTDVQPGQRYYYRITAFTTDHDRSEPAGPASIDYATAAAPAASPPKRAR